MKLLRSKLDLARPRGAKDKTGSAATFTGRKRHLPLKLEQHKKKRFGLALGAATEEHAH